MSCAMSGALWELPFPTTALVVKELIKHGTAADPEDAVRVALKAGG